MTASSSKQGKGQISILTSIVLIGVLVIFGPLYGSMYGSIRNVLLTKSNTASEVSINDASSFASDLQDWNTRCSHGWKSDSVCDALVSKVQSCSIGTGSIYCSEYDAYLQQFLGQ